MAQNVHALEFHADTSCNEAEHMHMKLIMAARFSKCQNTLQECCLHADDNTAPFPMVNSRTPYTIQEFNSQWEGKMQ